MHTHIVLMHAVPSHAESDALSALKKLFTLFIGFWYDRKRRVAKGKGETCACKILCDLQGKSCLDRLCGAPFSITALPTPAGLGPGK